MEKEKRQNAEGNGQYLRLKDLAADDERFARMLADPWSSEVKRGIKRLFFFWSTDDHDHHNNRVFRN